ncbi:tetratricopeptide repeat protein [Planctomycetota bacterium]
MSIKTVIVSVVTATTLLLCASAIFTSPENLWLTPDQQAQRLFDRENYTQAASLFSDPLRRGIAFYAAEDFDQAAGQFVQLETAEGFFNLGNTYCHLEKIPDAIIAYKEALALQSDYPEAQFNLEFARLLLPPKRPDDAPDADPSFDADEIRFDNTENKGKAGEVELMQLSDEQIADLWMRRVQTTPADFLRMKFKYDVHIEEQ